MKKTMIFGDTKEKTGGKTIELVSVIGPHGELESVSDSTLDLRVWDNAILLSRSYTDDDLDVIMVYDDNDPLDGLIYFGHWNEGVV
jgi:hypothetical protein